MDVQLHETIMLIWTKISHGFHDLAESVPLRIKAVVKSVHPGNIKIFRIKRLVRNATILQYNSA